jgi:hypothetical protein
VPVDLSAVGVRARDSAPAIEQVFFARPVGVDEAEGERRAFRAAENRSGRARCRFTYLRRLDVL